MRCSRVLVSVGLAVLTLAGCSEIQAPQQEEAGAPVTLTADHRLPDGTTLPTGTVLSDATDESGRPFLRFQLPEGYKLVSMNRADPGGEVQLHDQGGLTCTCDAGNGCSPFRAEGPGGTVTGCAMSATCTQCTGKVEPALAGPAGGLALGGEQEVDILDMKAGVSFITDPEELAALSCPRGVTL